MASGRSDTFETQYLELLFKNTNAANIGDATGLRGSSTAGNFYIALFTVAPTDSTSGTEANYTGYARVAVPRSAAGWTVSGNQVSNAALITFGQCTSGSNTIVAAAIMTASSGGTIIEWVDGLSLAVSTSANQIPEFAIGALTVTVD
jgi:hypothetical protein